jgi:putative nucleotidyltransferase with HDIG domain
LEELQAIVQADPSLVAQILRRVNSPYYQLDAHVQDLTVAARLLGLDELSNIAFLIHLSRMFAPPVAFGTFSMSGLWSHSVAVAAVAQLIARVCGCARPAEAFLAGLLHDIGLLLCCRQMRRRFMQVVERLEGTVTTPATERRIYAFDHGQLGAHVAQAWELPASIVDAIAHHHDVTAYLGLHETMVCVVAVANHLCSRSGWSSLGLHNVPLPPDDVYHILKLDQVVLGIIWDEISHTLDRANSLLET